VCVSMYMCVCLCVCMCMCICLYMCVYVCVSGSVVFVCFCVCMCVCLVCVCVSVCLFVCLCVSLCVYECKLDRIYKYNLTDSSFIGWLGKCTGSNDLPKRILCDTDSMHSNGFACTDSTCSNNNSTFGRDVGQFFEPASLAIDGLDNVYVGDIKLARDIIEEGVSDPRVERDKNDDGTCPDGFIENEEQDACVAVFNKGTVPRVQKFTQNGFFVEQVISNTGE